MKKEKILTCITIISFLAFPTQAALPAFANAAVLNQGQAQAQEQRMQSLKTRADNEIARRITSLNTLTSKVNLLKRLSADQKIAFTADIQDNISSLTELKTKINADTDLATLKADVKSIVDNYRIYALYIPKIHLLAGAEAVTELTTKLTAVTDKLETKINAEKEAGKNVTALQSELTDLRAKISDALVQAQNVTNTVIPLTPSGYPGNSNNLSSAHQLLKLAKSDIQEAKQISQKIIQDLNNLEK